jgi:hypothetical protein
MKKLAAAFTIIGFGLFTLNACKKVVGDGPIVTEARNSADFTEVEFEVPGDLTFLESEKNEVIIEAQRNIIDVIETYVSGNELKVKIKNNTNISSSKGIHITVMAKNVHSLKVSGSGNLEVPETFEAQHIKLRISGSGKMVINNIRSTDFEADISGSGNLDVLGGTADSEVITISGSGDVNLLPVTAKKVNSHTSGSGTVRVNVSELLDAKISGSGDLFYQGTPAVNANVSGSGRIIKL